MKTTKRRSESERFWAKVDFNGPVPEHRPELGPCWLWTAATRRRYGAFYVGRNGIHMMPAHRFAYEFCVGPIPDGLTIDHLCRICHCQEPDHLEPVTNRVNVLRGEGLAAANARKTHCPKGHAYDLFQKDGRRYCRRCVRGIKARSQKRIREAKS